MEPWQGLRKIVFNQEFGDRDNVGEVRSDPRTARMAGLQS
jgi:hypothetical protein